MSIIKSKRFIAALSIILLCICLGALIAVSTPAAESDFLYGDVDGNGKIDVADVLMLRKYMANYNYDTGASTVTVKAGADANGDGSVNVSDILVMRKYMANYNYDTGSSTVVLGPVPAKKSLSDWKNYTVVYKNDSADTVSRAFVQFNLALEEKYNFIPSVSSDFLMPGESVPEGTNEILVGLTNRPESAVAYEKLKANDYFIGMINNRLVIVGGSDKATAAALDHFVKAFMEPDGLYYPTAGYTYEADYIVDTLTVGGVDISRFVLVRGNGMSANDRNLVNYLCESIADICGVNIEVRLPSASEETYEMLLGNTGRSLTSKEIPEGTYSVIQTETKLAIYGNGVNADSFILYYLIVDVLGEIPEGESYDISLENVEEKNFTAPALVTSNLPEAFGDFRGKYDDSVASAEATVARFMLSVEELPDEVSIVEPILLEDYKDNIQKQVYVSNYSGNDSNDGSEEHPFKTIAKAVSAMKNASGGVIWIEGDTYALTESVVLSGAHSGTVISPLFIKSYGGREVTLTSNVIIESSGFKLVDPSKDKVADRLHDNVKDKVYSINLYTELGWSPKDIVDVTTSGPARLYVDGEEFTLARFPNAYYDDGLTPLKGEDYLYFTYVYDSGSVTSTSTLCYWPWVERANADPDLTPDSIVPWEVRIPDTKGATSSDEAFMGEEIKSWVNTGDIWYYGNTYSGWEHGYYTIAPDCVHGDNLLGIPKAGGYYSLKSVQPSIYGARASGNSATGRNTFYLFNAIEALDAPGEWFIDKETGYLYIYPKSSDITKQQLTYSGPKNLSTLLEIQASYVVVDGIGVDGCNGIGIRVNGAENVVLQNITTRNTNKTSVAFVNSRRSALINSWLSYSYGTMVSVSCAQDEYSLTPTDIFIQNNKFFNPPPSVSNVVSIGGCRIVVSHNDFVDCCVSGGGTGAIIEYNKFEGGNRFITDGGMVYLGGLATRGHHVRYNLFHMFKATHQAVYFDTMGSGMYSYGNVISMLGAWTNSHKAWYSSTGHGNVCYANIMVLRNAAQIDKVNGKDTDEQSEAIRKGDDVNESGLFYYYYGDGAKGNSEAAHWWRGMKESEIKRRFVTSNEEAWRAHYPDYMNSLLGDKIILAAYENEDYIVYYDPKKLSGKTFTYTDVKDGDTVFVPEYKYLDSSGSEKVMPEKRVSAANGQGITLTYDDISAMERLSRQPAFSAIWNNIFLGGSSNPNNLITNSASSFKGLIKDVTIKKDNFFEFDYDKIMVDAENHDYTITDEAWTRIENEIGERCAAILKEIDCKKAGATVTRPPVTSQSPVTTQRPQTSAPVTTEAPVTTAPAVVVDPFEDSKYKPEVYYDLYVKDGLLLHLNFATAHETTPAIVGGESYNNPEVSAQKRFAGAASNYNPFVIYSQIDNPVNGGTAKILTPWYFENWYKDGYFDRSSSGSGNIADMQTEEPLEYAKLGNRNGTTVYIRNTNMYHANYYYNDDVWVRRNYASYWGNGFLGVGEASLLNVGKNLYKKLENGYTLDIAFSGDSTRYFVGGRMYINTKKGSLYVTMTEGNYIKEPFNTVYLTNTVSGAVNTVSLTVETKEDSKASFSLYGNGASFGSQTLKVDSVESLHQFCSNCDFRLYATRIYSRPLSADEVAQNHFADIAIQNKLDITEFLRLNEEGKRKVYEAFKGKTVDAGRASLQAVLDSVAGVPPTTQEPTDKWEALDFDGAEIIMHLNDWESTTLVNAGATNGIKYIAGPDQYTTDSVQNAVFDRNRMVTSKLGLNIRYNQDTYASTYTLPAIENFVLADLDDAPDIIHAPGYDMVRAGIKGLLYNALTEETENYFELTDENGWYTDFMFENTLDESKVYLLAGDYFIDVLRYAYGVLVNTDMYDDIFSSEGGIDELYKTVQDGNWTYDELIRCADAAYVDSGAVGAVDESDIFGVAANASWYYRNFFSTSGLDIFEEKNGKIAYKQNVSDVHTFVDKLMEMMSRDSFLDPHAYGFGNYEVTKLFTSGRSLFALDQFILTLEGSNIRSMDGKVGVLPFPKYSRSTDYGALISDNGNLGGILLNSDKFTECSALLQMMCEESNGGKGTLIYEYYDVTLKYKYSSDEGQIAMLELIRNGICSPKSMLFDNYFVKNVGLNTYGVLMTNSIKNGTNTFASDWASQYSAVQQSLEDTYKVYGSRQ